MIWFTIKFLITFLVSFLILSINIGKTPLFNHLYDVVGPLGNDIKQSVTKSIDRSVKKSSEITKKALSTKKPKPQEKILESEKKKLDSLIGH
ncbi:MAG: hypothetical protein N4A33_10045 [Bacteriovoracaceae bacterium]|jgi:hypothetical protein|nr:hypothetical protein [Bacteriovoracaceae bacterium]